MCSQKLPLIDLSKPPDLAVLHKLRQSLFRFGAFRITAPAATQLLSEDVFQKLQLFFREPCEVKSNLEGYSDFGAERLRGKTPIPMESFYKDRQGTQEITVECIGSDFDHFLSTFYEQWVGLRSSVFSALSLILESEVPLSGTPSLDHDFLGLHYYNTERLSNDTDDLNPAHRDRGTIAIVIREPEAGYDCLEVADLDSRFKTSSEEVGQDAMFIPVPSVPGEIVVFAGTKLQQLLGKDLVRACVHRVRSSGLSIGSETLKERLSVTIDCAHHI